MDLNTLRQLCLSLHRAHNIPIRLYDRGELAALYDICSPSDEVVQITDSLIKDSISASPTSDHIIDFSSDILLAGVLTAGQSRHIVAGPVRINVLRDEYVMRMLQYLPEISPGLPRAIYEYLKTLPVINPSRLADIMNIASIAIKGVPSEAVLPQTPASAPDIPIHISWLDDDSLTRQYESSRRILYMVKNGMTDLLKKTLDSESDGHNRGDLRSIQNDFISMAVLASTAAVSAGVSPSEALRISASYQDRIEFCRSYHDVISLKRSMLTEFCALSASIEIRTISNPLVRRAVGDISRSITHRRSCSDIAASLGVSRGHLSACFKEEMGIGMSEYINRRKIAVARELLRFTDLSLSDIASRLSFSSQSYFQNVFRSIAGMTPLEYRRSCDTYEII